MRFASIGSSKAARNLGADCIVYFFASPNYPMMVTAISSENFFSGMGNAAYSAFLMSLCNPKFTATQFALLTSLMALTRTIAGTQTGWLAKTVGWETYYVIALLLMIPSLLLLTRFKKWHIYT